MLRTAEEMAAIASRQPVRRCRPEINVQVFFLNEPPPENLLETLRNRAMTSAWLAGTREVYVAYGERGIGRTRLRIPAAEAEPRGT